MIDLTLLIENPELAKNLKLEIAGSDLLAFGETIHKNAILEAENKRAPKPEKLLTPQQFADILQVSLVTLWSWDKKGITSPVRIGNAKRYRLSDVENFLKGQDFDEL